MIILGKWQFLLPGENEGVCCAYGGNIKGFDFWARHLRLKPMAVRVFSSAREFEQCGSGSRELGRLELGQA